MEPHLSALVSRRVSAARGSLSTLADLEGLPDGAIAFGGGYPDPSTYPVAALERCLAAELRDHAVPSLSYDTSRGDAGLRAEIAVHLGRDGIDIDADRVNVYAGSSGGINAVADLLLDDGDVVVTEALTYPGAVKAFEQRGARVVPCPIDEGGVIVDDLDAQLRALGSRAQAVKLLYLGGRFHNPTGACLDDARTHAVAELARRHGVLVAQDDTYADIRYGTDATPSLLGPARDHAIQLGSFSKSIAPGVRLGWVAAPPRVAELLAERRTDLGASPLLQRAVARYLRSGDFAAHLETLSRRYLYKRDVLLEALAEHCAAHATWTVPTGGYFVWVTMAGSVAALSRVAREYGTAFISDAYFAVGPSLDRSFRLAFGEVPLEQLAEGARRLGDAMRAGPTPARAGD
ncbi:MAG TPA: PLP-dependent aminotransferase family protein [Acidimicrobiales bacterium]|jgi:2-aminoadipate transaminase|nr:PLP-dependent aminotransferase family protein [Acidimicrobiales bacterium]